MRHPLLVLIPLPPASLDLLQERFEVLYAPDETRRETAIATDGERIEIVLTNGTTGISAVNIDRLPRLRFLAAQGVG